MIDRAKIAQHAHPDFPIDVENAVYACKMKQIGFLNRSGRGQHNLGKDCLFSREEMERIAKPGMEGTWSQIHADKRLNGTRRTVTVGSCYATADLHTIPATDPIPKEAILSTSEALLTLNHFLNLDASVDQERVSAGPMFAERPYSAPMILLTPFRSGEQGREALHVAQRHEATEWDLRVELRYYQEPGRAPDVVWSTRQAPEQERQDLVRELMIIYGATAPFFDDTGTTRKVAADTKSGLSMAKSL